MSSQPTSTPFDAYSHYYNLLYQDKNYEAEVEYITGLLKHHGVMGPELLEFGSGTGRHGRLLASRGYRVLGVERSAAMVANVLPAPGFDCIQGDIRTVRIERKFDAVLSLFHVMSYLTENTDVQHVFDRAAEHLRPGGLFIFDVWYSPAVYAQRPETRVKRMFDDQVDIVRIAEPLLRPNENRVDVNYSIIARNRSTNEVETIVETHPMRHFSLPELEAIAQRHGFSRLATEEFISGNQPSERTWGVCIVLRKDSND